MADSAQSYDIAVRSYEIDSYLYVVGPGIVSVDDGHYALTDDDSGDGLDAAVCFRAPKDGRYHVVTAALYGETGEYTLSVKVGCGEDEGDVVVEAGGVGNDEVAANIGVFDWWQDVAIGHTLDVGVVYRGRFDSRSMIDDDGRPVEGLAVVLQGGRQYAIDLVSDEFDALLRVLAEHDFDGGFIINDGPRARGNIVDDDGGLGSNSRLCVLVPEGGPSMYQVVASTVYGYETEGSYGLVVTEDPDGILCPTVRTSVFQYNEAIISSATEGRFVDLGSFSEGYLSANEWRDPVHGVPMQVWHLRGAEVGDTVVVMARSGSLAPEVAAPWGDPQASVSVTNECSAFVTLALPAQRDDYTLAVYLDWRSVGESLEGAFSLGAFPASEWELPESCEETVVRDLRWSQFFGQVVKVDSNIQREAPR